VGNSGATNEGPAIFDPACFFGHHEMELAMMTLFGGFRYVSRRST
jgi:fructosamine-3-kinase